MKTRSLFAITMIINPFLVSCSAGGNVPPPKEYEVNCAVDGVTFSTTKVTEGEDYQSKIYLNHSMIVSGVTLPFFLIDVTSGDRSLNFYDYNYNLAKDNTTADFYIPSHLIQGDITVKLELIQHKRWFEYENWWEYCSSGVSGEEAAIYDIGREVDLKIDDVVHKIRLIDIDKDVDKNDNVIHSTFEFANTLNGVLSFWNRKDPVGQERNFDFINHSSLNDCMQPKGDAYKKIPNELMSTIKFAKKHVDVYDGKSWGDKTYITQLFPLSHNEIDGTDEQRYRYYIGADNDKRKKQPPIDERVEYYDYQTRSPNCESIFDVWAIDKSGEVVEWASYVSDLYSCYHGVAPVFCI